MVWGKVILQGLREDLAAPALPLASKVARASGSLHAGRGGRVVFLGEKLGAAKWLLVRDPTHLAVLSHFCLC